MISFLYWIHTLIGLGLLIFSYVFRIFYGLQDPMTPVILSVIAYSIVLHYIPTNYFWTYYIISMGMLFLDRKYGTSPPINPITISTLFVLAMCTPMWWVDASMVGTIQSCMCLSIYTIATLFHILHILWREILATTALDNGSYRVDVFIFVVHITIWAAITPAMYYTRWLWWEYSFLVLVNIVSIFSLFKLPQRTLMTLTLLGICIGINTKLFQIVGVLLCGHHAYIYLPYKLFVLTSNSPPQF